MTIKIIHKSITAAQSLIEVYINEGYSIRFMTLLFGRAFVILTLPDSPTTADKQVVLVKAHKDKAEDKIQEYLDDDYEIEHITAVGIYVFACLSLSEEPVASPTITGITGPGGASITNLTTQIVISGSGFGLGALDSEVIFLSDLIVATSYEEWSDTSIICNVTNGHGEVPTTDTGRVRLLGGTVVSNDFEFPING